MIGCVCATHPVGNDVQRKRNRLNQQIHCFPTHPDTAPPRQMLIFLFCMRKRAAVSAAARTDPTKLRKPLENFLFGLTRPSGGGVRVAREAVYPASTLKPHLTSQARSIILQLAQAERANTRKRSKDGSGR